MTRIQTLENKIEKSEANHYARLIAGLEGKPYEWDWTGEIIDNGFVSNACICGHQIRYQFPLINRVNKHRVIVGCVCVKTYHIFSEEIIENMENKIKEIQSELRAKKAESKQIVQKEEIKILVNEQAIIIEEVKKIFNLYKENNEFAPRGIWFFANAYNAIINADKYTRLSSAIKALKINIEKIKYELAEVDQDIINKMTEKEEIKKIEYAKTEIEYKEKIEEIKNIAKKSNYVGCVGGNIEIKCTFIEVKNISTIYGNSDILKFIDEKGNILVKWGKIKFDFELNNSYTFTAQVKAHSEFSDRAGINEKQTVITRIKGFK